VKVLLRNIISKTKEIKKYIKIIESQERIDNEIKLINKGKSRIIDMKILIKIGYKRKGRMIIELINDDIILIEVMYDDYTNKFKNKKELNKLLGKMIKLFNGICGSISHENTLPSIIKADRLPFDNNIHGFYDIKWNNKVKIY